MLCTRLLAERRLAPRRYRTRSAYRTLTFASAVRVIARVHNNAAYRRLDAHMAFAARFTERYQLVIEVADLTDRRAATLKHHSHFAGRKSERSILTFFCHKLCRRARSARHLTAASRNQRSEERRVGKECYS